MSFRPVTVKSPIIILLGDDIMLGFGGGTNGNAAKASWTEHMGACSSLNFGVAGDKTEDLLWRVEHGLLSGLTPRAIILHIGLNDQPSLSNGSAIAGRIQVILTALQKICPESSIILIDTVPGYAYDYRALHDALSLSGLNNATKVHRINTEKDFVNINGSLKVIGASKNQPYLDEIGFELIASRIGSKLQNILGHASGRLPRLKTKPVLRLIEEHPRPLITAEHPDSASNAYGLEGGMVVKQDGVYHMITAEMCADIRNNTMRLAHWSSSDRINWQRRQTIAASSGDLIGNDLRAALWGPMPIFDESENLWNLFYVAYRSCNRPEGLDGRIWRAVAQNKGRSGINGPWTDVGVIMSAGAESQAWEGIQGVDSFFPYRIGQRWLAFYGSSDIRSWFRVGLAEAPQLAGPWTRLNNVNPIHLSGPRGSENPIVTQLPCGRYLAMFETVFNEIGFGYSTSEDGVAWSDADELEVVASNQLLRKVRTPLGLIAEDDGTYSIFYTGFSKEASEWGQLWHIRVALDYMN